MIKEHVLYEQFFKFGIVGVSNTLVSLSVYYVIVYINAELYVVGGVAGFFISVLNSYYWNNRIVFKSEKRNHLKSLVKTYISYGTTFLLSIALLVLFVEVLKVSEIVAPLINLFITIPINFMLNKYWAFK